MRVLQSYHTYQLIEQLSLKFSDSSSPLQTVTLRWKYYNHYLWEDFALTPVNTSSVKLTAVSLYTMNYNGFIEVEFYTKYDECTAGIDNCHHEATCVDIATAPGYHCQCPAWYYGDGRLTGTGCQAMNKSINVAVPLYGASCTDYSSSSSAGHTCNYALDGLITSDWATADSDSDKYMVISLNRAFILNKVRLAQRTEWQQLFQVNINFDRNPPIIFVETPESFVNLAL